jgi:hypothetical protein
MATIAPEICRLVDGRAGECCEMCGRHAQGGSRHHRRSKRVKRPDTNMPANLVLLCGSGSTGCHGWVHGHVAEARELGLIVSQWATPADIPITLTTGVVLLDDYGNYIPTEGAA